MVGSRLHLRQGETGTGIVVHDPENHENETADPKQSRAIAVHVGQVALVRFGHPQKPIVMRSEMPDPADPANQACRDAVRWLGPRIELVAGSQP